MARDGEGCGGVVKFIHFFPLLDIEVAADVTEKGR